jgi:hypothetical protein
MSAWTGDELDRIGAADELVIAPARADIDAPYRAEYAGYGETYVGSMVGDDAAAATFRLLPH